MAKYQQPVAAQAVGARDRVEPLRVLLVDSEQDVYRAVTQSVVGRPMRLVQVPTMGEARQHLSQAPIDLALIACDQPDGEGILMVREIAERYPGTQTILLSRQPTLDGAMQALRAGADDLIVKPLNLVELRDRISHVAARHRTLCSQQRKVQRLQRVCRKLNQVRKDVAQQVDILCKDLVTAYQELAEQMQQVVQTSEFAGLMRQELDLEAFLRKTLEFLLQKVGSTNAAIFLPSNDQEYSLGGYVNYDCTSDSADVLLQHLADVAAPRFSELTRSLHLTDNATLREWLGDDAAYMEDNHVIIFSCSNDEETLAVFMLFRDQSEPFAAGTLELCDALAPMLAEYLMRLIRIHHRHLPHVELEEEEEDDTPEWGSAA